MANKKKPAKKVVKKVVKKTKPAMKKETEKKSLVIAPGLKPQPEKYKATGKAVNKQGSVVIEQDTDADTDAPKGKSVVIRGGKAMLVNDDEETGE